MAGYIQVPSDGVGKRVDTVTLTDALVEVHRQKMVVTGGSGTAEVVVVTNAAPAAGDMGLVVRQAGTIVAQVTSGTFNLSGTALVAGTVILGAGVANIGTLNNISAPIVLAAGTSNIGTINNISANVAVSGSVALLAGTANIGFINNISATVQVAIATPFTVNNISAVVAVSGNVNLSATANVVIGAGTANIGSINNISAPIVLAAGTANIGTLNGISATVQVAIGTPFTLQGISTTVQVAIATPFTVQGISAQVLTVRGHLPALPTASHGPRCVTASTSAGVALIAAPGAGFAVYITQLACTNGSGTLTRADVFPGSATASAHCQMYMAASGGGFVLNFDPPIAVLSNTGVTCRVKPNVSQAIFNVHFYVEAK